MPDAVPSPLRGQIAHAIRERWAAERMRPGWRGDSAHSATDAVLLLVEAERAAATPQPEPSGAGQPPTSEAPPGLPSPLGGARVEESTPNEYPDAPDPASMVRDLQDALRGTTGGIARPHSPAQEWAALLAEVRSLAATPQPEEHDA